MSLAKFFNEDGLLKSLVNQFLIEEPNKALSLSESDIEIINHLITIQAARNKERDGRTSFSAGNSGYCMRRQILDIKGYERKPIPPKTVAVFIDGIWRNISWVVLFNQMGILVDTEKTRHNKKYDIGYTPDAEIDLSSYYPEKEGMDRIGVEVKGMHEYEFSQFKSNKRSLNSHWAVLRWMQVHSYMLATGAKFWIAWGQNKNNQDYEENVIKRDPLTIKYLKLRYKYMSKATRLKKLPAVECSLKSSDSKFRYCSQSDNCVKLLDKKSLKPMPNMDKYHKLVEKRMLKHGKKQ